MAYLWDSNILRYYSARHPQLHDNLSRVPKHEILIPLVVYAEQLRGRIEGLLKAEPHKLLLAQQRLKATQDILSEFAILDIDEAAIAVAGQLKQQIRTRKRYADMIIAAQTIAGHHILITRNTSDFHDLLPAAMLQNWIDESMG
jgi:predicted nucleic acid-binding protein